MKYFLLSIILIVMAQPAAAQVQENVHRETYPNGKIRVETEYNDGFPNGMSRTYYEDGTLSTEWKIKNGRPYATGKSYYQNGKLHVEWILDGYRLKQIKEYDEYGQLISDRTFDMNEIRIQGAKVRGES